MFHFCVFVATAAQSCCPTCAIPLADEDAFSICAGCTDNTPLICEEAGATLLISELDLYTTDGSTFSVTVTDYNGNVQTGYSSSDDVCYWLIDVRVFPVRITAGLLQAS